MSYEELGTTPSCTCPFCNFRKEMGIDGHGWEWYLKLLNQIDTYNSPKMHLIIFIFESRLQCNKNLVAILVKKLKISKK